MTKIKTPKSITGTRDIEGLDAIKFNHIVDRFNSISSRNGYQRMTLPVIEPTELFVRSVGETSDIVSKEMFTFDSRGGTSITLRPEFTAGIARAYVENGWANKGTMRLATSGPLFRYERPQAGRYRQFNQLDIELIGKSAASSDVEIITLANQLLDNLQILPSTTLQINTLGDTESRLKWTKDLVDYYNENRFSLSNDSNLRLYKNPLRILDSKDVRDIEINKQAPTIDAYLTSEASDRFELMIEGLDAHDIQYVRNLQLVRGLDYYNHTIFEYTTEQLGAQNTVLAGGRYDNLIAQLGGKSTPAIGRAAGIERLSMLLDIKDIYQEYLDVVVVLEDDTQYSLAMKIVAVLRSNDLSVEVYDEGSLRKRFDKARKIKTKSLLTIGQYDNSPVRFHNDGNGADIVTQILTEGLVKQYIRKNEFENNY
jgi:histidyl-tRNA synthetase